MTELDPPRTTQPVVDRDRLEGAPASQVAAEKEVTRHDDRVPASRRHLPMVEVQDGILTAPEGPVRLTELVGDAYLLPVQNVVSGPDWDEGCPSSRGPWTTSPPTWSA